MLTRRVLIADSDPHMQAFVKRALAKRWFRIPGFRGAVRFTTESVSTDDDAIRDLTIDPGDVVIVEHRAPGVNSLKTLETVRSVHPHTTAIVAAAHPSIPAAVEAAKLGAFAFLAKPVSEQRFHDVLLEAVSAQMGCAPDRPDPSRMPLRNTVHTLKRIRAALVHVATAAASLI